MTEPVSGPTPPQEPPSFQSSESGQTPFQKMFGGNMTPQELTQFINQFLKDMITQMKQNDQAWQQAMDQLKKSMEGDDD